MNNKKILLVEDEPIIAKAYFDHLSSEGYTIEMATDGEEALEKLIPFKPDLILLDIILPKLDGLSVLKEIRAMQKRGDIGDFPIIMLTNLNTPEHITQAIEAGPVHYLVKSDHSLSQISETVKSVIGTRGEND